MLHYTFTACHCKLSLPTVETTVEPENQHKSPFWLKNVNRSFLVSLLCLSLPVSRMLRLTLNIYRMRTGRGVHAFLYWLHLQRMYGVKLYESKVKHDVSFSLSVFETSSALKLQRLTEFV